MSTTAVMLVMVDLGLFAGGGRALGSA